MELIDEAHRLNRLLPLVVAAILFAWVAAALSSDVSFAVLLDKVHCTIACFAAAWLTWRATGEAGISALQRETRQRFAAALSALALAQFLYDVSGNFAWWPLIAGPDDAFFLLAGPIFIFAFAALLREELPALRRRIVLTDIAGFALAILALTLALYLPYGRSVSPLQMAVFAAFPVTVLTATATALVMQLHLRQRWSARWTALFLGLGGFGAAQMIWYMQALDGPPRAGTLLSLAFPLSLLSLAWGASGWRLCKDASTEFDRLCESILRQLPLAMVALGSGALGLLLLDTKLPEATRVPLLLLDASVLLVAVIRQTQELGERDRLLAAERTVAESQARIEHLAHHDPLTGLPNLTLLQDRVQLALSAAARHGKKVALLFLDLDQFKAVNDTLGHAAGDALLKHVAGLLQRAVRASDTVSRQGGDEFTIVLPDVDDGDAATRVAEKLMQIASTTTVEGYDLPLSLSVGIALYPDDAGDFASLLQCADTAMYRAKAAGRNAFRYYDPQMNAETINRVRVRMHLARAIERGELQLHYQPLIDLSTTSLCGAEALLRWQSAELGSVSPVTFIPVAEDFGLIVEIGGWVLLQVCRQAAAWRSQGLAALRVAVNVSVMQFRRGNLEMQVHEALRQSGLDPHALELEVTESVLMQDQDRVIATLERLAEMGVSIAIDDFGTGYSSLSYVRRMRVKKLKIDKSFVHEALQDAGTAAVVRAMIEMARALNVATVAEGVETEAQLEFLRSARCDIGQGFLFARPMDPEAFARYVADHS